MKDAPVPSPRPGALSSVASAHPSSVTTIMSSTSPPRIVSRRGGRHWCFSQLPSEGAVGGSTLTAFRGVADWSRPTPPITLGEEVFASYFQSRAILVSWALIEITQRCACIYSPEGLTPQFVGVLTSELFGALFVRSCPARGARGGPIGK